MNEINNEIALSNFMQCIKLDKDVYAVFNNLIMDVYYVNQNELSDILHCNVNNMKKEDVEYYIESGIFVKNKENDRSAIKTLREINNSSVGKIGMLYLILTQSCNLNCSYCFLENNPCKEIVDNVMSFETAKIAIDKYYDEVIKEDIHGATIMFYGGEPLLNEKVFKECVKYIRTLDYDFIISVITNGTILNEKTVKFIKANDVKICISLDGPKNIHNKNRRYKKTNYPSFTNVMKSYELLKKYDCDYGISLVVSQDVLEHKEEVLEWLLNFDTKGLFLNILHFSEKTENMDKYAKAAAKFIIEYYKKSLEQEDVIKDTRIYRQIESLREQKFAFSDCGAKGLHQLTITPNGDICICHGDSVNKKNHYGNIRDFNFDDLESKTEYNEWKGLSTLYNKKCLNCEALFCCGGGCPQQTELLYGEKNVVEDVYCEYVKTVLFNILKEEYENKEN